MTFIFKKTGAEVSYGDVLSWCEHKETAFSRAETSYTMTLSKETEDYLIGKGIIKPNIKKESKGFTPHEFSEFTKTIFGKLPIMDEMYYWKTYKAYPGAFLSIVLEHIAREMDENYEEHIRNSEEIFVISFINGKVYRVNKGAIKNYKCFAAFRTLEDAKEACVICSPLLKQLF